MKSTIYWILILTLNINVFCHTSSPAKFSHNTETSPIILDLINGSRINYRISGKKGKGDTWFEGRENHGYCVRYGKCELLKNTTCLGSLLPYTSTSLDLTDLYNQNQVEQRLYAYQSLRHIPKCWAVIQPFLCSIFTPKCEKINNKEMVYLPSQSMCKIAMDACRLFNNTGHFQELFKCDESIYPKNCSNDAREMKFNLTSNCLKPLVQSDSTNNYYKDIDGCNVQCTDPLYTEDEHRQIHKLIGWGASICIGFNVFTIATFLIDWKNANKYPALVIFYINVCFMMSCLGWIAQFTPGGRDDIICRKDGTLRAGEPSAGENLSCIVVFVLVYYFLIAAMVWFVIFTYAWHMSFKSIGKIQDRIDKKGSYFHLVAWSLPLVLTITIMALSEVDGNSIVGICFVGYINHGMRASLLLGPILGVLLVGGYFLGRGMLTLIQLKITSKEIISARASNKIRETIVRMGLCTLFILVFILATFVCHINEFRNTDDWAENLRQYIKCKILSTFSDTENKCKIESRPSVAILQLHLLCFFASGITMSSWVWTHSTVEAWGRYIRRKCGYEIDEPVKLQKHKLIAQAFAKRKEFQNQGRLSISFHNSHTDPVGLNFDLNSVASHDFSSTWANNLPRFVNRRYALTGATTSSSHGGPRRNSMDSEISFSYRQVSVESRRNSVDSQVSVKYAEMKTKVASRSRNSSNKGKNRHRRQRDFTTSGKRFTRKESSTSMESQIVTALQKGKYTDKIGGSILIPNNRSMKRRSGNAGLDSEQLNVLLSNGKLILPFLNGQGMTTSDDENCSNKSFKIKDSRLDVILRQVAGIGDIDSDDDDEDYDEKSEKCKLNSKIDIQEYNTTDDEKMCLKNNRKDYSPKINIILDDKPQNQTTITGGVDCLSLKNSKDGGRISKNSIKSIKSRKSSRQSNRRSRKTSSRGMNKNFKIDKKEKDIDFDDSSFTSFGSELCQIGGGIQSSFSGISLTKTNSRNSKRSCDVGIQTNAHEIATQTMSSYDENEHNKKIDNKKSETMTIGTTEKQIHDDDPDDDYTENHQLLAIKRREPSIIARKHEEMSETEKLKMLLFPSK